MSTTALVHVPHEGRWLRVTERHSEARRNELRRYAGAFDDGYYWASRVARERFNVSIPFAASYADLRDFICNFTDDEILAARVALELVGPARSSWLKP